MIYTEKLAALLLEASRALTPRQGYPQKTDLCWRLLDAARELSPPTDRVNSFCFVQPMEPEKTHEIKEKLEALYCGTNVAMPKLVVMPSGSTWTPILPDPDVVVSQMVARSQQPDRVGDVLETPPKTATTHTTGFEATWTAERPSEYLPGNFRLYFSDGTELPIRKAHFGPWVTQDNLKVRHGWFSLRESPPRELQGERLSMVMDTEEQHIIVTGRERDLALFTTDGEPRRVKPLVYLTDSSPLKNALEPDASSPPADEPTKINFREFL